MELKRYRALNDDAFNHHPAMVLDAGGDWVRLADVQQLQHKADRFADAIMGMLSELHRDGFVFDKDAPLDNEVARWLDQRGDTRAATLDDAKAAVMKHHAGAIDGYRWLLERICDDLEALKP